MKIKVFGFARPYFSMWGIPTAMMESEIETWLLRNPGIRIEEIKHDSFQGIWFAPQLVISIYYTESNEE